jgi:SNF2 family DNA or RNA helicase
MAYALYEHQQRMLRWLTERSHGIVQADPGTGKTLPMLIHLSNLMLSGEVAQAVVFAPLAGLAAWERDIEKLHPERQRILRERLLLMNYDRASRQTADFERLLKAKIDAVVLDEGHALANPRSKRTKAFLKSTNPFIQARYRYVMTGTLITNARWEDVWAPVAFVFGGWLSYPEFEARYCVTRQLPGSYARIIVGYRRTQELQDIVAQESFVARLDECLDMPEELPDEVVLVPWADEPAGKAFGTIRPRQLYEQMLDSYIDSLSLVADTPLSRMMRLRQIAAGHITDDTGEVHRIASLKFEYALEYIESNRPRKTVVFYNFTDSCRRLCDMLDKKKIRYIELNGQQKDKRIWRQFQEDPSIEVAVVQYRTGGAAIDLYAASLTIFLEPTDSSSVLVQARARTRRSGQTRSCLYVFLLTESSIEETMYETLQSHTDFTEKLYRELVQNGSAH